jgi:hypothetical protein
MKEDPGSDTDRRICGWREPEQIGYQTNDRIVQIRVVAVRRPRVIDNAAEKQNSFAPNIKSSIFGGQGLHSIDSPLVS